MCPTQSTNMEGSPSFTFCTDGNSFSGQHSRLLRGQRSSTAWVLTFLHSNTHVYHYPLRSVPTLSPAMVLSQQSHLPSRVHVSPHTSFYTVPPHPCGHLMSFMFLCTLSPLGMCYIYPHGLVPLGKKTSFRLLYPQGRTPNAGLRTGLWNRH